MSRVHIHAAVQQHGRHLNPAAGTQGRTKATTFDSPISWLADANLPWPDDNLLRCQAYIWSNPEGLGFRVLGLGSRVWGLGFGVWGLGFGV